MGKPIVYCGSCGESIREEDFDRGKAHLLNGQPFCTACRPLPAGAVPVRKPPTTQIPKPPSRKTTTAHVPLARPPAPLTTRRTVKAASAGTAFAVGGALAAAAILIVIVAAASSGRKEPAPRKPLTVEPTPPSPRPPASPPDSSEEKRATPMTPAKSDLPPEEILRQMEAFAASSTDPDAVLQKCDEALLGLRGRPQEARLREIESRARDRKKAADADRKVTASILDIRKLQESDPACERREEVLRLLRATLEIAGPRRAEVEKIISDYERRAREAEAAPVKPAPPTATRPGLPDGGPAGISFQDGVFPDPSYAGTQDATILESAPDKAQGSYKKCKLDGDNDGKGNDEYALIRWDLSSIPPGSRILSASLTLYLTEGGSATPYRFYGLKRGWSETGVTWNSRAEGQPWEIPGARGPTDRGPEVLGSIPNRDQGQVTLPLNPAGVALVQSWIDRPATNNGIIIADTDIKDGSSFASREEKIPERRPRLTIVPAAGGRRVHFENFESGCGKFRGGAVVEGGMNGSRALSVPATLEGTTLEGIAFPTVRASSLVRFWVKPSGNIERIEIIAWSGKLKTNVRTHAEGLRRGEWNRVEIPLIRMHKEYDGTGPTLEGEAPDNLRIYVHEAPADAGFLVDDFEILE